MRRCRIFLFLLLMMCCAEESCAMSRAGVRQLFKKVYGPKQETMYGRLKRWISFYHKKPLDRDDSDEYDFFVKKIKNDIKEVKKEEKSKILTNEMAKLFLSTKPYDADLIKKLYFLLDLGADPKGKSQEKSSWYTILDLAILRNNVEAVRVLIAYGADIEDSLNLAISDGKKEVASEILNRLDTMDVEKWISLMRVALRHDNGKSRKADIWRVELVQKHAYHMIEKALSGEDQYKASQLINTMLIYNHQQYEHFMTMAKYYDRKSNNIWRVTLLQEWIDSLVKIAFDKDEQGAAKKLLYYMHTMTQERYNDLREDAEVYDSSAATLGRQSWRVQALKEWALSRELITEDDKWIEKEKEAEED